jgi:hypothetical protein
MPAVLQTRQLMDAAELSIWILRYLGAPFIKVELTQEAIDDAIEEARRWFTSKKGYYRIYFIPVVQGGAPYVLEPEIEVVVSVAFSSSALNTLTSALTGGFGPGFGVDLQGGIYFGSGFGGNGSVPGPLSGWVQTLMYLKQMSHVFSTDLEWRQEGRSLYLFPTNVYTSGTIAVEFKTNTFTIEQLPDKDHELVKRYALMACKKRVGRIRSKYIGGFPTAQGNSELDGQNMLDEAKAEEEQLNIDVYESGYPMGFMLG